MAWNVVFTEQSDNDLSIEHPVTGENLPSGGDPVGQFPRYMQSDEYLKVQCEALANKFRCDPADPGHLHTGVAGDGPKIVVSAVCGEVFGASHVSTGFGGGDVADRQIYNSNLVNGAIVYGKMSGQFSGRSITFPLMGLGEVIIRFATAQDQQSADGDGAWLRWTAPMTLKRFVPYTMCVANLDPPCSYVDTKMLLHASSKICKLYIRHRQGDAVVNPDDVAANITVYWR